MLSHPRTWRDGPRAAKSVALFHDGEGRGTKWSTYVDITAVNETTGKTVRVQTVDTLADGITPDKRERAAIARIREKFPNDELWIIPKR